MTKQQQQSKPLTAAALLGTRRYEELSASEQTQYGQLRNQEADAEAQAIVDNLNRHTAKHGH